MRFAFLQYGMTGYQDASLRALDRLGHDILNVYPDTIANTAFDVDQFCDYAETFRWSGSPPADEVLAAVERFEPDVIMMASWRGKAYRRVMRAFRGQALRLLFSSNLWQATPRQWLGRATHRWYLDPLYDCAFVPGDRSEWFARRLGFSAADVIRGANSADVELFDRGPRSGAELAGQRRFLFSGRLMEYKGVSVLARAYRAYRERVEDPWSLTVVGVGPLAHELEDIPGVDMAGFVPPAALADLLHQSSCLVLPSLIDFYGVIVHEAATAGLPLLCSAEVGAVPHLLQDGFNGWTVAAGDAGELADALVRISSVPHERLGEMSRGSRALATRLDPEIWARNLAEETGRRVERLRAGFGARSGDG